MVSTERLILMRSQIFGGISNEISVLLDDSTLPRDLAGSVSQVHSVGYFHENFKSQQKGIWKN